MEWPRENLCAAWWPTVDDGLDRLGEQAEELLVSIILASARLARVASDGRSQSRRSESLSPLGAEPCMVEHHD